ncbi:MAG: sodium:calcium antiporter [Rhodospirillaceae bacterium]|nr:sodium:calcium antiporter [Rhodospirillaceae bacterium]
MEYALVVGGLLLLFGGGEVLVNGAVSLANRLGVSPLIIGLTVVGFGTSAPELLVSLEAALGGQPDIAVGNVVGSNIANILLILGAASVIYPIRCAPQVVFRDGIFMLASAALFALLAHEGIIPRWQGAVMFAALLVFVGYSYWSERYRKAPSERLHRHEAEEFGDAERSLGLSLVLVAVGFVALIGGSKMLVSGALDIARAAGISEAVIGLSLVAVGTSLPELATSCMAAVRKHTDVAVGNVLGSNIFNILSVLGLTAIVEPVPISSEILGLDLWIMLGVSVLVLPVLITGWRINRVEGGIFLLAYAGYIAILYGRVPAL